MILWCLEVFSVANAGEGSTQEHDWAKVELSWFTAIHVIQVFSA